jgi:hypothetical protein
MTLYDEFKKLKPKYPSSISAIKSLQSKLDRAREILSDWMELEDETKPWFGTDQYFSEYQKRFARARDFLDALNREEK